MNTNMTHRELAELMASGWGEWTHNPSHSGTVYTTYKYTEDEANEPIGKNSDGQEILIRKFRETAWIAPTKEVYNNSFIERRVRSIMGW